MLPIIPPYRPFGQPAVAYVDILQPPTAGDKITVNGVDYTYGTNFFGVGRNIFSIAQAMAEAIRGEPNNDAHNIRALVGPVTAVAYGSVTGAATARLYLIATSPGTAGNALTLTTNNAATFAISGATFSGGTAGASVNVTSSGSQSSTVPSSFAVLTATGTVFTLAAGERGFIQNLNDAALHVKLGAAASTSSFNFLLKAGAAADDGTAGYINIDNWIGAVSVASTGAARYVAWKI